MCLGSFYSVEVAHGSGRQTPGSWSSDPGGCLRREFERAHCRLHVFVAVTSVAACGLGEVYFSVARPFGQCFGADTEGFRNLPRCHPDCVVAGVAFVGVIG